MRELEPGAGETREPDAESERGRSVTAPQQTVPELPPPELDDDEPEPGEPGEQPSEPVPVPGEQPSELEPEPGEQPSEPVPVPGEQPSEQEPEPGEQPSEQEPSETEQPSEQEQPSGAAKFEELEELEAEARRQLAILREHARDPSPPPRSGRRVDEFVWGFAQPLLGIRVLLRHGDLFVRGLIPGAVFILVVALAVERSPIEGLWAWLAAFYGTLISAAALSPVVFCRNYAKLAAEARRHLDVPRQEPYLRSFKQALGEFFAQAIVLGIGVAPLAGLVGSLPLLGGILAGLVGWIWVVHWLVVEALDSARTLPPDQTIDSLELRHAKLDPPWYSGAALARLRFPIGTLLLPIRLWGMIMARIGRRWRGEVAVIELRPWLAAGFGLAAFVLALIPVLNLLFRPAVVIAASHVLGRLEPQIEAEIYAPVEAAEAEATAQAAAEAS